LLYSPIVTGGVIDRFTGTSHKLWHLSSYIARQVVAGYMEVDKPDLTFL